MELAHFYLGHAQIVSVYWPQQWISRIAVWILALPPPDSKRLKEDHTLGLNVLSVPRQKTAQLLVLEEQNKSYIL